MDKLDLMDLSRELASIYAISFVSSLCLKLLIDLQTCDMTWAKF
jgi:hypothetical protein